MSEFWLFILGAVQALGSVFAGLTWFGITPKSIKMPVNKWVFFMVILGIGSLGSSAYGLYKLSAGAPQQVVVPSTPLHWTMTADKLEVIYGKTYRNEKVELDGKKFDHCIL